ncbi:ribosome biogenesis GTPase Der [Panacagrimonas sp.]|uniref:ribosome biogenesis GTPase Der n=1 Tax=Panacagrimonas sp. TaxID=2480088 RepID=UPI003B5288C3
MSTGLPVIVLVGRPNVGKSTLFNRLTGTRDALVADFAGLTRDRQYGCGSFENRRFVVVDTGGLMPESADPLAGLAEDQARLALEEASHILFLTDLQAGRHASDAEIARLLRRTGKPLTLLVNKAEGHHKPSAASEFYELGLGEPLPVSAQHGDGIAALLRNILADVAPVEEQPLNDDEVRVAIVGRPNVGKSTLVNRLIGEERVVAADQPGTTRDAIRVPFEYEGKAFVLIDTAGVRRRSRVEEVIEKFSVIKTLQAVEQAHVVIVVVDAQHDIGEQDARLMGLVAERGRAMVLAVNKWDHLKYDERDQVRYQVGLKMPYLDYVPVHYISARHGSGLGELMIDVQQAFLGATIEMPTPELTRILERSVDAHNPPAVLGRRIKLRYAHQSGSNPPKVLIHGNQTEKLPVAYRRYLVNEFRAAFKLKGVPLQVEFKTGDNPFKDKKNKLTPRQIASRKRMIDRWH